MPDVLAICPRHGPVLSSIYIENIGIQFQDITVECPICGADARVPDGFYSSVGDTINFIAASERSSAQLRALHRAFKNMLAKGATSEDEVAQTLDQHFPTYPGLRRLLPKDSATLTEWIRTICAVLAVVISGYALWGKKQLSEQEINALITKAMTQQQAAVSSAASPQAQNRAQRRAGGRPLRPKRHK